MAPADHTHRMVDDPATDKYIKWAEDGNSFYVFNPDQFAKELLGTYYKTDASASFVRQLNMYGFHKVPHVRQGALKSDKQAQAWHYQNPNFKRGRPDLLPFISRKGKPVGAGSHHHGNLALQPIKQADIENDIELLTGPINDDNSALTTMEGGQVAKGSSKNIDMSQIINGLATIKRHQILISDNLKELQGSNQALWQEAMEARERHRKHQETINRILKFLATLFQGSTNNPVRAGMAGSKGKDGIPRPRLMITGGNEKGEDKDSSVVSPKSTRMEEIVDEDGQSQVLPPGVIHPADVETPTQTETSTTPVGPNPQNTSQAPMLNATSQYPFNDQGHLLANGAYIPPTDAYKILQWLQQNQIQIPGVYTPPTNPQANTGTLTTIPPGGNPFAFVNTPTQHPSAPTQNPQNAWPTYTPAVPSQPENMPNAIYQNENQLFNTLLPLASVANEPAPPTTMADVSHNSGRLEQLSNHVEAMQQGIDSLISGIGLDPLAASSLSEGTDLNLPSPPSTGNANQFSMATNPSNQFSSQPQNMDVGSYQPASFDFDLDSLLRQIGVAAAANTPPALHGDSSEDTNTFAGQIGTGFDALFNSPNMYAQSHDPFSASAFNQAAITSEDGKKDASGLLDDVTTSPVTTRGDSLEPVGTGDGGAGTSQVTPGSSRGRVKKRKNESVSSDDATTMLSKGQSRSAGRSTKRRK